MNAKYDMDIFSCFCSTLPFIGDGKSIILWKVAWDYEGLHTKCNSKKEGKRRERKYFRCFPFGLVYSLLKMKLNKLREIIAGLLFDDML